MSRVLAGGGRSDRIHIALATTQHPLVRETLAYVTHRGLVYLDSCYVELGAAAAPGQAQRSSPRPPRRGWLTFGSRPRRAPGAGRIRRLTSGSLVGKLVP
jgi:hypothetical protein